MWSSTRNWLRGTRLIIVVVAVLGVGAIGAFLVAAALKVQPQVAQPSPGVSPENGWIAVSANPGGVGGGEAGDIHLIPEPNVVRRIIGADDDGVAQACPMFSPDGSRLAFGEARASGPVTTFRGVWPVADRAVVVVGLDDDGDPAPLARVTLPADPGELACPEWSPSGTHLAVRVGAELWIADAATGAATVFPVTDAPWGQGDFEWSRDGSLIAVAENGQIRVLRTNGDNSTVLEAAQGATPSSLSWTAGDERIFYLETDGPGDGRAVHSVGVDGNDDIEFTEDIGGGMWFHSVVVDPSGERVAFVGRRIRCAAGSCRTEPSHLLLMDIDGSNRVEVSSPLDFGAAGLQWSPDGERLLAGSIDGIVSIAVDPGQPQVVHEGGALNLEWSPSELTWQALFP